MIQILTGFLLKLADAGVSVNVLTLKKDHYKELIAELTTQRMFGNVGLVESGVLMVNTPWGTVRICRGA